MQIRGLRPSVRTDAVQAGAASPRHQLKPDSRRQAKEVRILQLHLRRGTGHQPWTRYYVDQQRYNKDLP